MIRTVVSHLRRSPGRALALVLGVVVAAAGFLVLTGTARQSQLQVVGTATTAASHAPYQILVRPHGSRTQQENGQGLVRGDALSGIFGGISTTQYTAIAKVPGVDVAAPIEILGYATPGVDQLVDVTTALGPSTQPGLVRSITSWTTDGGTTHITSPPSYLYRTPRPLSFPTSISTSDSYLLEKDAGSGRKVCVHSDEIPSPFAFNANLSCASTTWRWDNNAPTPYDLEEKPFHQYVEIYWPVPILIAAIDPEAEAKLDGLDRAVTRGRYLRGGDTYRRVDSSFSYGHENAIPLLLSTRQQVDLTSVTRVRRSTVGTAAAAAGANLPRIARLTAHDTPGPVLAVATADQLYAKFVSQVFARKRVDQGAIPGLTAYWTGSQVRLAGPAGRTVQPTTNPNQLWFSKYFNSYVGYSPASIDVNARRLTVHQGVNDGTKVDLDGVGMFDPDRLTGFSDLSALPLGVYQSAAVTGADTSSRTALHDRQLLPNGSLTGYLQQTPTALTTIAAARVMLGAEFNDPVSAPISDVRIRVAGVTGVDAVSRARVNQVVAGIQRAAPGLDVDVTLGASPAPQTITLPAGRYGRPQLALTQNWVKKGVATAIISAVDRKSLVLFVLVLVVCALVVANAAFASVRTRTSELGVLACLGWRPRRLFGLVAGELVVLGIVAGAVATVVAVVLGHAVGAPVSWRRAAWALPASVGLSFVAGMIPALVAARSQPMAAIRAGVVAPRRASRVRGVLSLAWANLRRRPGRSVLAASGLVIAVAAFTLLLAVTLAFRGTLVGSLLGGAVDVEVRGVDYAAIAATLALAAFGVADVLYIAVHERAVEFATLRALGWREAALSSLLVAEGTVIGLAGSLVGGAIGLVAVAVFAHVTTGVVVGALVAAGVGTLVAVIASVLTVVALRTLRTVELLSMSE